MKVFNKFPLPKNPLAPKRTPYLRKTPFVMHQNLLNGLRLSQIRPGEKYNNRYPVRMEKVMKRNRIALRKQRAHALEAHELQQLARENATMAMSTLIEICKNKRAPETCRIAASVVLMDRGYGKASQTSITASVSNVKATEINATELDKRIDHALRRVEELTNRTPKTGTSSDGPADIRKYN